jgi:hypothetical protein
MGADIKKKKLRGLLIYRVTLNLFAGVAQKAAPRMIRRFQSENSITRISPARLMYSTFVLGLQKVAIA